MGSTFGASGKVLQAYEYHEWLGQFGFTFGFRFEVQTSFGTLTGFPGTIVLEGDFQISADGKKLQGYITSPGYPGIEIWICGPDGKVTFVFGRIEGWLTDLSWREVFDPIDFPGGGGGGRGGVIRGRQ